VALRVLPLPRCCAANVFEGEITILSDDTAPPVDRPNLSKDYLAGNAPEEWVPMRPAQWYRDRAINLRLGTKVARLDPRAHEVEIASGERLATGAAPVRLNIPGATQPRVHTLRSLADCRAIIAGAQAAREAVVIGASFIGLEVAASLRARNVAVHVVAPEKVPLEKVFGRELGAFIQAVHEEHGVVFHLEQSVTRIESSRVALSNGETLHADLVVMGVGVRPRVELPERAGLKVDRGVTVTAQLETSAPDIFAAGDIARWTDRRGESLRVEHWVVAERQGQVAACNMLGAGEAYNDAPFFWSQHYDMPINYVGHAERWDATEVEGDFRARDGLLRYRDNGRVRAVASIGRDVESLSAELKLES
jgi:NADPH-dependent 2,4-dienoyl-CoA reductase/sulfur reductase-like enzyme